MGELERIGRRDRRELRELRRKYETEANEIRLDVELEKLRLDGIQEVTSRALERLGDIDETRKIEVARAGTSLFSHLAANIEFKAAQKLSRVVEDL